MYGIIALVAVALGAVLMVLADRHPAPATAEDDHGDDSPDTPPPPQAADLYDPELLAVLAACTMVEGDDHSARTFARCALMAPSFRAARRQQPDAYAALQSRLRSADAHERYSGRGIEPQLQTAFALAHAKAPGQKLTLAMLMAALRQSGGPIGDRLPPWLHEGPVPGAAGPCLVVVNDAVTTFEQAAAIMAHAFQLDAAEAASCAAYVHHLGWYRFGPYSAEEAAGLHQRLEAAQQQQGTALTIRDIPPSTHGWEARSHGLLAPAVPNPEDDPFSWVAPARDEPDDPDAPDDNP